MNLSLISAISSGCGLTARKEILCARLEILFSLLEVD